MMLHRISMLSVLVGLSSIHVHAFVTQPTFLQSSTYTSISTYTSSTSSISHSPTNTESTTYSFIDTDLRGAAMKLHTRKQAPKEGQAPDPEAPPYQTTHLDYLHYLVDSHHVFQALEHAVNQHDSLSSFRNTGLERTKGLELDIQFLMEEYDLTRPEVGTPAKDYATVIETALQHHRIPEFMCHYYNFYFAHTAGGRMIGKQMSALLLDKKTLEFYKWDGDVNEMKEVVKQSIEDMAATWSAEDKLQCVDATAAAFQGGGGINANLRGVHK